MVLTQHSSMKHSLCNWGISVPQFNFSTTLCSIQSLLRCYILIHMIYRPIQNLNSKIHNAKNSTHCPKSPHQQYPFPPLHCHSGYSSIFHDSSALCLSPRQCCHHLPFSFHLLVPFRLFTFLQDAFTQKMEKTSICSRLPGIRAFISLFLSSQKR